MYLSADRPWRSPPRDAPQTPSSLAQIALPAGDTHAELLGAALHVRYAKKARTHEARALRSEIGRVTKVKLNPHDPPARLKRCARARAACSCHAGNSVADRVNAAHWENRRALGTAAHRRHANNSRRRAASSERAADWRQLVRSLAQATMRPARRACAAYALSGCLPWKLRSCSMGRSMLPRTPANSSRLT